MATVIKIPLEPVISSNLKAMGYDQDRQRAAVQFHNDKIIYYAGVGLELFEEWCRDRSLGGFYARRIRGKFQGELMTGECPKCGDAPGFVGETCVDCGCAEYAVPPKERADGKQ